MMARGRKTGGRQAGSLNKATVDVKEAAQAFTADAINTLASIMKANEQPAAARVAAASALLDRGYGKPKQSLDVAATVQARVSGDPLTVGEWSHQHAAQHSTV
jgi:hypothetical protein